MNRKKLRVIAACVLTGMLVTLVAIDRRESARAALREQCSADAAIGAQHVLAWQTATDRPLDDILQQHIADPARLGFSAAGRRMLQHLAAHTKQWAAFRSDTPERYEPILYAACLAAN